MLRGLDKWAELTEADLRVRILDSVQGLTDYRPDQWPVSFLDSLAAEQAPAAFVAALKGQADYLKRATEYIDAEDLLSALRHCSLILDSVLRVEQASYCSLRAMEPPTEKIFLVVFSSLAVENADSNWRFEFPPDQILEILGDWGGDGFTKGEQFGAEIHAYAEIERFVSMHPRGAEFGEAKEEFSLKASRYVRDSLSSVIPSVLIRLGVEACLKFLPEFRSLDTSLLDSAVRDGQDEIRTLIAEMNKVEKRNFASRFGLKERRGGPRNKGKTGWTDEMKIRLFETAVSLPKISDLQMWEYAVIELMEKDFDSLIVQFLRSKTPLKDAPATIFNTAVKTWKKYKDAFGRPKEEESHKAFALYHANAIIGGTESEYSTLRTYFYHGRKLAEANENGGGSKK